MTPRSEKTSYHALRTAAKKQARDSMGKCDGAACPTGYLPGSRRDGLDVPERYFLATHRDKRDTAVLARPCHLGAVWYTVSTTSQSTYIALFWPFRLRWRVHSEPRMPFRLKGNSLSANHGFAQPDPQCQLRGNGKKGPRKPSSTLCCPAAARM